MKLCFGFALVINLCAKVEAGIQTSYYADNNSLFTFPRSAALSGSDLATSTDASPISNPANFVLDTLNTLQLSYASFFQNSYSTSLLSYTGPVSKTDAVGITLNYSLVPGIEITEGSDTTSTGDPVNIGLFPIATASELFFRAGYSHLFILNEGINVALGAALDAKRRRLPEKNGFLTGYGIGIDAGATATFLVPKISLSALIENITTSYTYWSSSYQERSLPHLRIGAGWQRELPYIYGKFQITFVSPDLFSNEGINTTKDSTDTAKNNVVLPDYQSVRKHPSIFLTSGKYGFEYVIADRLALRVGATSGLFSFGGGLYLLNSRASLDFAYLSHDLSGTYQLSVTYRW